METEASSVDAREPETSPAQEGAERAKSPAWELVEKGRYRPRRIRGSLLGRELG
jgi:hypothetical protein